MGKYYILNRLVWFRPMLFKLSMFCSLITLHKALDVIKGMTNSTFLGVSAWGGYNVISAHQ
jgi:hypothetical protein